MQANESILRALECSLRYAHARVMCSECNCTKIMQARYFRVFFSIVNSDWLQLHVKQLSDVPW